MSQILRAASLNNIASKLATSSSTWSEHEPKLTEDIRRVFTPRVGFDTFDNKEASDFSLSLQSKHKDYEYTKRSRTFLCGTDMNDYSEFALEWLIDELVDDGDEIVCLRVVEKDSKFAGDASIQEGKYREEANKMMEHIQSKNTENKAINLVLEFSVGKVQDTIQNMIKIYEPAILVVGTRGRSLSGFSGIMSGSVSKYCLQSSPVPVIVVRPTSKRNKKKRKRAQDPSRHGYRDILDKSGTDGTQLHMVGASVADDDNGGEAGEGEAKAVLDAIGYNPGPEFAQMDPFAKYQSERNDITNWSDVSSPRDLKSPGPMMKSPELQNLESPPLSDASSDEDEDEYDEEGGIEAVPGHTLLQVDEANRKAREAEKEIEAQAEEKQKDEESEDEGKGKGKAVEGKDSTHADLTENIKPRPKGDRADSEEP
ncbi:MAG: hypothetical protein M1820_008767 [Bogoriella megaspora]|nr:MAG: hypothetical protein M1820_008767 [Bogoriella megaspora]